MKNNRPALCAFLLTSCHLSAATIIPLTPDAANSTAPGFSSGLAGTLNDSFAYDPIIPTSATPNLSFGGGIAYISDEPDGAIVTVDYDLNHFVAIPDTQIVVDIWGRNDNAATHYPRDNDFDVEIFDSTGSSLGFAANQAIADSTPPYVRITFPFVAPGTTISDLVITARDSDGGSTNGNLFTIQEIRMAAIPEPSSALLIGLGALGFISRRKRAV